MPAAWAASVRRRPTDSPLRPPSTSASSPGAVPAPVLWRDPAAAEREDAYPDAVLSIGEVALLSAAGGIGKSMTVLALAVAAAGAHVKAGAACGLRVMAGPVALVSYEDSPARLADRLRFMVPDPAAHVAIGVHLQVAPDPAALWTECGPGPDWAPLWRTIRWLHVTRRERHRRRPYCLTPYRRRATGPRVADSRRT